MLSNNPSIFGKMFVWRGFLLATVVFVATGCSNINGPVQQTTPTGTGMPISSPLPSPQGDWTRRWLEKIPCSAPCFENVTPGLSTVSEAIEIWNRSPIIHSPEIETASGRSDIDGYINWKWPNGVRSGGASYRFVGDQQLVDAIEPDFRSANGFKPFQLREVMSAYGEPQYVVATTRTFVEGQTTFTKSAIWFLYAQYGFGVGADIARDSPLSSDMEVSEPLFFSAANLESLIALYSPHRPNCVLPWQGIHPFAFYECPADR